MNRGHEGKFYLLRVPSTLTEDRSKASLEHGSREFLAVISSAARSSARQSQDCFHAPLPLAEIAASRWKIEVLANSAVCRSIAELIRNGGLNFRRAPEVVAMFEGAKVSLSAEHDDPIGEVVREKFFDALLPLIGERFGGARRSSSKSLKKRAQAPALS